MFSVAQEFWSGAPYSYSVVTFAWCYRVNAGIQFSGHRHEFGKRYREGLRAYQTVGYSLSGQSHPVLHHLMLTDLELIDSDP